jgi:hypothetical protein
MIADIIEDATKDEGEQVAEKPIAETPKEESGCIENKTIKEEVKE